MTISDAIDPYRIAIDDELLDDLHDRLRRSRFPEPLPADNWSTGVPRRLLNNPMADPRRVDPRLGV